MEVRSYRSPRRASAAIATRRAVLDAALDLFQSQGYGQASMSEIAANAAVSLNTVYTSVGNKPHLLIALIEDASMDQAIDETLEAVATETVPERVIELIAEGTRGVFERNAWVLGALYDNAASDPQIAAVTAQADERYRSRIRGVAGRLAAIDALATELGVERAAHILWFYFGFRPWRDLRALGWSWEQAQAWLTVQAVRALRG